MKPGALARLGFTLLVAVALAAGWAAWDLRRKNVRAARRVADLQQAVARTPAPTTPAAADTAQIARATERLARGDADAVATIHAELEAAKRELATQEERAQLAYQARGTGPHVYGESHDPQRDLTRLEFLQNLGRATPEAAVQTIAWAALHGDDATLLSGLTLTDDARAKGEALLARLPDDKVKSRTPEALGALFLADQVLDTSAIQILGREEIDAQHVVVKVRRLESVAQPVRLLMALGPDGWQLVLSDKTIDALRARMNDVARPAP